MDESKPRLPHERVLVVDDAREIRDFLTEYILVPQGFEVLTAADGLSGLQIAFSERPDLMIVDVQMPNMSGLELLRRLQLRRVNIPAILITAHGSEQVAVQALRLGVRDYVIKPFVVEEMEEAISRALRESRLISEREQLINQLKRSNSRLRQRAQELNALYSIGKAVSSSLDLEKILQRVIEAAVYLSNADQGSIMLLDEDRGELYVRASKNVDSQARPVRQRIEDSTAGQVLRNKQTAILGEGQSASIETHSTAYVPLVIRNRPIGVLTVSNQKKDRSFTKRETRVLSALASFAASAIQNAKLHDSSIRERNQLRTLINQISNAVLVIDTQKRLVLVNQAAREVLNLPEGELVGRHVDDIISNQELQELVSQPAENEMLRDIKINVDSERSFRAILMPIEDVGRSVLLQETHD